MKKRAVNLWFFTSCTFFCRRAPLRAKRTVLSSPSLGGGPAAGSAILRAGSGSTRGAGQGPRYRALRAREAREKAAALPPGAADASPAPALAAAARGAGAVTRPAAATRPAALGTAGPSCGGGRRSRGQTPPPSFASPSGSAQPRQLLYILAPRGYRPPREAFSAAALRRGDRSQGPSDLSLSRYLVLGPACMRAMSTLGAPRGNRERGLGPGG